MQEGGGEGGGAVGEGEEDAENEVKTENGDAMDTTTAG